MLHQISCNKHEPALKSCDGHQKERIQDILNVDTELCQCSLDELDFI